MTIDNKPEISVIIPTYNRASIIEESIESVRCQSFKNWECIIVDDFSDDNTREVVEGLALKDNRIKYLINKNNKGATGARNTGINNSEGDFLFFHDSDDIVLCDCFENRLKEFRKNPELDLVVTNQAISINGKITSQLNIPDSNDPLLRFFSLKPFNDIPWINNYFIRKSFLIKHQIFWNENLVKYQDIQFNLNIMINKPNLIWINSDFDSVWKHNTQISTIGKKADDFEILFSLVETYVSAFHKISDNEIKKKVQIQLKASIIDIIFILSINQEPRLLELIEFCLSENIFNRLTINLIMRRINLDSKPNLSSFNKIIKRFITLSLKELNRPFVNDGKCGKIEISNY